MTVGTQVRHTDFPEWFGQVSGFGAPPNETPEERAARIAEYGPSHDVQVQWAHTGGKPTGHRFFEVRPELFAEYLFKRKGSFGKWDAWAGWWTHWMIAAVAIAVWWAALPILAAIYIGHYLQFRGIFK
jgi:hypothetical protein